MNFLNRIDDKECLGTILKESILSTSCCLSKRLEKRLLVQQIDCIWKAIILPLEAIETIKGLGKKSIYEFQYRFRHLDYFPVTDQVKGELMDIFEKTREHFWEWSKQKNGVPIITSRDKLQFVLGWCAWEDFEISMNKAFSSR
jgi:hypothetical protein